MVLPQIRLQPWYPGQMGVSGSDVQRGLRWDSQGIVLFVDENHPNATADADGTDPENPLTTIQLAITRLTNFATAMSASLAYYDAYRSARLPANLIQAQRDYFGAHTYERIDRKGVFHTEWKNNT